MSARDRRPPAGSRKSASPALDDVLKPVREAVQAPGTKLDPDTRSWAETRFEHDFSDVRVHVGAQAAQSAAHIGAQAYAVGPDIVFGADRYRPDDASARGLLAHELAHVVQDSDGRGHLATADLETEADRAGSVSRATHGPHLPLFAGGRAVHPKSEGDPPPALRFAMLLALDPLTKELALQAFEAYRKIAPADRLSVLASQFKGGELAKLLRATPRAEAIETFPNEIREMLRFIEESSTREASGKSDDEMADVQAKFQIAQAQKDAAAAAAAKAPGTVPLKPTEKDVEEAREARVAKTSIKPVAAATFDAMDKATQDDWRKRAQAAADAVVAFAQKTFPELKLGAANFRADFPAVEKRGVGVLAFEGGTAALHVAVFGFEFVRAAEADPAYVLGVVVHELFGHREYGTYGTEYHLALYDQAQKKIPGYVKPADNSKERTKELDAYAYQETEIYANLRSLPYSKSIDPKDAGKALVGYEPAQWAKDRIATIKSQWAPDLAGAIVRGLYQRLLLDPRISGPAINAFRDGVRAAFTADEAEAILK